jgi:adenylate kinase family enzyme
MNSYSFDKLHDKEFEALSVDLLSGEHKVRYERFKPGKDQGVDGRWFATPKHEVIVQCKHWAGSGFQALLKHMATAELQKIILLRPARYILITSVPLTRANKTALSDALAPFVLSPSDIFGAEDLNDLIGRHPSVERSHYKLWLSGSGVLQNLLNNAIVGRSRDQLQRITENAYIYAVTTEYSKALRHLEKSQVLILSGEPGIGKTTLARQLIIEHVSAGYQLLVMEEDVSEVEAAYVENDKQLFYFDDFLGRTFLEALKAKQDSHIVNFIKRVSRDRSKRFILTSRTNILNQGKVLSDLLQENANDNRTYELRIGALSDMDKANILYNQLWYSGLSGDFVDEIYFNKRYSKIISHKNFNPRLIAFIIDTEKVASYSADKYWDFIKNTLQNPEAVWSHFFSAQMSQENRDLTILTVLNGRRICEGDLRSAFFALPRSESKNTGLIDHQFRTSVKQCTGSVLDRQIEIPITLKNDLDTQTVAIVSDEQTFYSLFNPSIADFVHGYMQRSPLWSYYFEALRTTSALQYLEQICSQPFLGDAEYYLVLNNLGRLEGDRHAKDAYSLKLAGMIGTNSELRVLHRLFLREVLLETEKQTIFEACADFLALFVSSNQILLDEENRDLTNRLIDNLSECPMPISEHLLISDVIDSLRWMGAEAAAEGMIELVLNEWKYSVDDVIQPHELLSNFFEINDLTDAYSLLADEIKSHLASSGIDIASWEADEIAHLVDVHSIVEGNIDNAQNEPWFDDHFRFSSPGVSGVSDVDDLFDRSSR